MPDYLKEILILILGPAFVCFHVYMYIKAKKYSAVVSATAETNFRRMKNIWPVKYYGFLYDFSYEYNGEKYYSAAIIRDELEKGQTVDIYISTKKPSKILQEPTDYRNAMFFVLFCTALYVLFFVFIIFAHTGG